MKVASPKHARIEATQRRVQLLGNGSDDEGDDVARLITSMKPSSQAPVRTKSQIKPIPVESPKVSKATSSTQVAPLKKTPSKENGTARTSTPQAKAMPASQPVKAAPKTAPSKPEVAAKRSPPVAKPTAYKPSKSAMDVDKFDFPAEASPYIPPPEKVEKQRAPLPMPVLVKPDPPKPAPAPVPAPQVPKQPSEATLIPITKSALPFSVEPFFSEKEPSSPRPRILFALTGSVATIKLNDLLHLLTKTSDVIVITTKSAEHFATSEKFEDVRFYNDQSEYAMWKERNDPVLHIELRKWADILLIAPLSANTLAKLANGLCDNLVTCVARAWDFERPFYVAPAMNTLMWTHPFTEKHLSTLEDLGVKIIAPVQKTLMCGDKGTISA